MFSSYVAVKNDEYALFYYIVTLLCCNISAQ